MSKLSDLIIEEQETGKRASLTSEQVTAKPTEPTHPSENWSTYWKLCLDVVSAAGDVAGKDKLAINFRDPQKRHSVKGVVDKSFNGELSSIIDKRADYIRIFFMRVDTLNDFALKLHLDQIPGMTLMGMLVDGDVREKFTYHIKRHIESGHPPYELDELPARKFRKSR